MIDHPRPGERALVLGRYLKGSGRDLWSWRIVDVLSAPIHCLKSEGGKGSQIHYDGTFSFMPTVRLLPIRNPDEATA